MFIQCLNDLYLLYLLLLCMGRVIGIIIVYDEQHGLAVLQYRSGLTYI